MATWVPPLEASGKLEMCQMIDLGIYDILIRNVGCISFILYVAYHPALSGIPFTVRTPAIQVIFANSKGSAGIKYIYVNSDNVHMV